LKEAVGTQTLPGIGPRKMKHVLVCFSDKRIEKTTTNFRPYYPFEVDDINQRDDEGVKGVSGLKG
jgi:hypothetical protein